ncbi:hypothetical protein QJR26_05655 [Clostridium baratii]
MNRNLKFALYFIITILVIGVVAGLFIRLLPYLLAAILVMWIIFKIRGYFTKNKKSDYNREYEETYTYESHDNNTTSSDDDDFDTSKAIDVDYEEIDKDK